MLAAPRTFRGADAAITRFANQYLKEHHSSYADLVCPPDLLRAIRSWEEGEPLPDFDFLPPVALTEAEIAGRRGGRRGWCGCLGGGLMLEAVRGVAV